MILSRLCILSFSLSLLLLSFTAFTEAGPKTANPQQPKNPREIRVLLDELTSSIEIEARSSLKLIDFKNGKVIGMVLEGEKLPIKMTASALSVPHGNWSGQALLLQPLSSQEILQYKNYLYRGSLVLQLDATGKMILVNHLNLDQYLYGVLPQEISPKWHSESIKAQAVASRTFSIHKIEKSGARPFDLRADSLDQVYKGVLGESKITTEIVNMTRGQALFYNHNIIMAVFHDTCSGKTENASEIWSQGNYPYLVSKKCDFCQNSPHFQWQTRISLEDISNLLGAKGFPNKGISFIKPESFTTSGRVKAFSLSDGIKNFMLPANDFRLILNPDVIRSTFLDLTIDNRYVIFRGQGWGHGVGFCQWGAKVMAEMGANYLEILKYYYSGTEIVKLY